ncbi:MAG: hypothetical protein IJU60_04845 [Acholeplasmatales bacterium]|nr:hypothetical protein [Acholeplasmatales bacterium]
MDKYKKSLENLETMSERLYIPGVDIKEIVEHYKELLNLRTHIKKRKVRQEIIEFKDSLNSTKEVKDNE